MMEQGRVRSALQYLSRNTSGGILSLDDMIPTGSLNSEPILRSTHDVLQDKHPAGSLPDPSSLLTSSPESDLFNPIIFESLNADSIQRAAMHTHGSAGPSGLDSFAWRRLCSSFGVVSHDLCSALAAVGRRLCSSLVNPESISAFVACRLIPLDKCPGVRPIGVGEVPRRIIAKAFGYHPNSAKTYLIVKEEYENKAKALFADTDVHVTINGKRHLGAALGANTFTEEYVSSKVRE